MKIPNTVGQKFCKVLEWEEENIKVHFYNPKQKLIQKRVKLHSKVTLNALGLRFKADHSIYYFFILITTISPIDQINFNEVSIV